MASSLKGMEKGGMSPHEEVASEYSCYIYEFLKKQYYSAPI